MKLLLILSYQAESVMQDRHIPFLHQPHALAKEVFEEWKKLEDKKEY